MSLPSKEVQCDCGHTFTTDLKSDWCIKCCRRVFYYEKDKRLNKYNNYYMYTLAIAVISFLAFFFMDMIFIPITELLKG